MTEEELINSLSDPWWRLTSGALYKIMIKGDNEEESLVVPFIPNDHQLEFFRAIHNRNLILKARQLGFTTGVAIYFLDCCLFRNDVRAGIQAQAEDVAKTIFRDKVKFAYDNLPPVLRTAMPLSRDSQSELMFAHNNSSLRVGTSMRSGTLQYLLVSEFGKIGAKFPDRAKEVVTGSIPAVPSNGVVVIESTAEGQEGEFYKMSQRAMALHNGGKELSKKDFKFHFFPWWREKKYSLDPETVIITDKDNEYFDKVEVDMNCEITEGQRAWWCATRDSEFSGEEEKMWQEYPSTPKEAFQKSTEGCYYSVQITAARKQGRITTVPHRPGYPVNTFWDIGNGDGTAIWLHQRVGQMDNFIGFIEGWGEPYAHYVKELENTGYIWGVHHLPHDGNHIKQGMNQSISPKSMLEKLGLKNIVIVKRVEDISHGIQITRDKFSNCWFDEAKCKKGIIHLESYKKAWNASAQCFMDHPKHDIHSEAADSFRQFAQGYQDRVEYEEIQYEGWR